MWLKKISGKHFLGPTDLKYIYFEGPRPPGNFGRLISFSTHCVMAKKSAEENLIFVVVEFDHDNSVGVVHDDGLRKLVLHYTPTGRPSGRTTGNCVISGDLCRQSRKKIW